MIKKIRRLFAFFSSSMQARLITEEAEEAIRAEDRRTPYVCRGCGRRFSLLYAASRCDQNHREEELQRIRNENNGSFPWDNNDDEKEPWQ